MVQALSISENIHTILRVLYDDMMVLCYPMAKVATAIAGIGALIYIAYRIWQAMARAEPIDLFPLLRPMAIGICIMFFPTLVLGSLNGILSPLVQATHSLMVGQTFDMQEWRQECARLEQESRERLPAESYYAEDEEKERELQALGIDEQSQQALDRMQSERKSWSVKGMILKGPHCDHGALLRRRGRDPRCAADLLPDCLSLLGPIAFAISIFDGFQNTLVQWFSKYISIYLWLPISDLFSAIIARLQTLSLQHDAEMMAQDYNWLFRHVEQHQPDLHPRGHLRLSLHPLDRLVGRAGQRLLLLQPDRFEGDVARERRGRMDDRQSVGRNEGCR